MTRLPASLLLLALAFAGLSACSDDNGRSADSDSGPLAGQAATQGPGDPAHLISEAKAIHARAQEMGHGWNVTGKYIAQAEEALQAGETERARALSERALGTATASLQQAETERDAWRPRFRRLLNLPAE